MGGGRKGGQPLVALLAVLAGWAGGRLSSWEPPFPAAPAAFAAASGPLQDAGGSSDERGYFVDDRRGPESPAGGFAQPIGPQATYPTYFAQPGLPFPYVPAAYQRGRRMFAPAIWHGDTRSIAPPAPSATYEGGVGRDYGRSVMAPLRNEGLPMGFAPLPQDQAGVRVATVGEPTGQPPKPKRWSVDAWALMRGDGAGPLANGALPATYGASQAGAILRYRLALESGRRPELYLRTTGTLGQMQRETAMAIGLAARPVSSFPVVAGIEARLVEQGGERRFQPAAMALTAVPPFTLPARFRGEAYGQAGYVAGKFATPFAEGQFRADHGLLSYGPFDARIGGGLWGGVQKGAGRLDFGPSATMTFPLRRNVFGRIGVDWRLRVAGDAEPGSGPTVTLSAGF